MSIGKKFLSAVIAEGSVAALLQKGPVDHLFKASEIDAYTFVRSFVKQYQALPTLETVEAHTGDALVKHDGAVELLFRPARAAPHRACR